MVHLYPPTTILYLICTTISYLIWSTSISQPLSPIRYGPHLISQPLSPIILYLPTTISYPIWSTSYLPTTISYPIWSTFISQPLSPIRYGPPLSPNHYLLSNMVHLYLPTTISYLIWSTYISQPLSHI